MIWNIIYKKINYLFLLSLTKAIRLIVRFFLKDAEIFLMRYPLLTAEPSAAWHYLRLTFAEIVEYALATRPLFFKLLSIFSAIVLFAAISLGAMINFNQAETLHQQANQFDSVLATQTASLLAMPLLLNNSEEINAIIYNAMKQSSISSAALYTKNQALIKSFGMNNDIEFPQKEIEYNQQNKGLSGFINNMLGKVESISRYTIPIKQDGLILGYLSFSFEYEYLEIIRVQTLDIIIFATLIALIIANMLAYYISHLLLKPLSDLLTASEVMQHINSGEDKHSSKNGYGRKDELEMLMESMNNMSKGLLQKDKMKSFFSRYVSSQVANRVLKDLDNVEGIKLGGEHIMASVFFADIVGFTSLSETLKPEEVSQLLNEYFSKVIAVVNFCNGHVDKFIGDCAMVLFGVPEKSQQHAFDCVACGWMILQMVQQLNDQREAAGKITVEFRIGANSGMMLAGNMGSAERMQYTVVGDSVNLASRLSGTCEPGQLIITEDVFIEQGLESSILTEVKDLIKLRGKKLPVKILNVKDILTPFKQQMLNEIPRIIAGETKPKS